MTREERINQEAAAFAVAEKGKHQWFNIGSLAKGFAEGAAWADENPQNPKLSAADRGVIDEIIFALNSLGKEKMISYHKEIEFLNKIRKL